MTIDALERQLLRHKYSPKTIKGYSYWLRSLSNFHNQKELFDLTPSEISQFFKHLARRYSQESSRQATVAIRYYYTKIEHSPQNCESIPSVKMVRLSSYIPSQGEILNIVSFVEGHVFRVLFLMIYGCGLELSDALLLKSSSVNLKQCQLKFKGQRGKERTAMIPDALISDLKELLAEARGNNQYIFTHKSSVISKSKATRAWSSARSAAGAITKIDLRSLRHAYVMDLVSHGFLLQNILRSMSLSRSLTLDYYSDLIPYTPVTVSPLDLSQGEQSGGHLFPYVSEQRIKQIQKLVGTKYDYSKLLAIINELNVSSKIGNYYSIALLLRTIIDHIAPVFQQANFSAVANNYPASRSLRKNLQQLDINLRNIADLFLHDQIGRVEVSPTHTQVDFRQQLDQLLAEMARAHTKTST